jgi:hypothetical protein
MKLFQAWDRMWTRLTRTVAYPVSFALALLVAIFAPVPWFAPLLVFFAAAGIIEVIRRGRSAPRGQG